VVLPVAFGVEEAEVGPVVGSAVLPVDEVVLVQWLHECREPGCPLADVAWLVLGTEDQRLLAQRADPFWRAASVMVTRSMVAGSLFLLRAAQ
jgi:hypothetical protein